MHYACTSPNGVCTSRLTWRRLIPRPRPSPVSRTDPRNVVDDEQYGAESHRSIRNTFPLDSDMFFPRTCSANPKRTVSPLGEQTSCLLRQFDLVPSVTPSRVSSLTLAATSAFLGNLQKLYTSSREAFYERLDTLLRRSL